MGVLDITFRAESGIEKKLSNLYPYRFVIDNIEVESFEGWIQSLRSPEQWFKEQSYGLTGFSAWKKGQGIDWWTKQELYWLDRKINRQSEEYTELITRAYDCLYEQCEDFRNCLKESIPYKLEHSVGRGNKSETLMTRVEYLFQMNRLRDKLTERKFYNLFEI